MEVNRYFIYDGRTLKAAQPKITGALKYYKEGRTVYFGNPESHTINLTEDIKIIANWIPFKDLQTLDNLL